MSRHANHGEHVEGSERQKGERHEVSSPLNHTNIVPLISRRDIWVIPFSGWPVRHIYNLLHMADCLVFD